MKYLHRPLAKNKQDALEHIQLITEGLVDMEFIDRDNLAPEKVLIKSKF